MSFDEAGPVSADDGDPVSADEAGPVRADDGEPLGGDEDEAAIPQAIPVLIEETADLEPPVEVVAVGATTEYRVAGRVFAVATERIFEVDLGAEVASAAVRTPASAQRPPPSQVASGPGRVARSRLGPEPPSGCQ